MDARSGLFASLFIMLPIDRSTLLPRLKKSKSIKLPPTNLLISDLMPRPHKSIEEQPTTLAEAQMHKGA